LNGKGPESGRNKYKKFKQIIPPLYEIYVGNSQNLPQLSSGEFSEFKGRRNLSWNEIVKDVSDFAQRYVAAVQIIQKFGDKEETDYASSDLKAAIDQFMGQIVDENVKQSNADVIFSTAHVCKGLEWDNVQLLGDFGDSYNGKFFLFLDRNTEGKQNKATFTSASSQSSQQAQMDWDRPGFNWKKGRPEDSVNLMYVAVTRAKVCLSIPTESNGDVGQMVRLFQSIQNTRNAKIEWEKTHTYEDVFEYEREYADLASKTGRPADYYHPMLHHCEEIWQTMFTLPSTSGAERNCLVVPNVEEAHAPETKEEELEMKEESETIIKGGAGNEGGV